MANLRSIFPEYIIKLTKYAKDRLDMKKISILFLGILILSTVLILAGCGSNPSTSTTQPVSSSKLPASSQTAITSPLANPSPPSGYVLVKSADENVSIFVPSGWNLDDTQLYPGSVIGVADDANKEYLIITEKPKSSLKASDTINDYLNIVKTAFGAAITNPVWGQPSNVTICGCKGLTVRLTGTRRSNNTETVYFVNALESKNYFYNVCGYTLTSLENTNKTTIEKIINSFKEKD
jgi:hypothetical protein